MSGTKVSTSALDVNAQEFVPAALNKKEVASSSEAIDNIEDREEEEDTGLATNSIFSVSFLRKLIDLPGG